MTFSRPPRTVTECDLMEENDTPAEHRGHTVNLYIKPHEIRSLKVTF